eukprot:2175346-Pleurochrysis_carterae.AAC.1
MQTLRTSYEELRKSNVRRSSTTALSLTPQPPSGRPCVANIGAQITCFPHCSNPSHIRAHVQ